jgi:hypothetical protein
MEFILLSILPVAALSSNKQLDYYFHQIGMREAAQRVQKAALATQIKRQ